MTRLICIIVDCVIWCWAGYQWGRADGIKEADNILSQRAQRQNIEKGGK